MYQETTDDGDYKIMVAQAGGRRSWVVVLVRASVFCRRGWEKSLLADLILTRCRLRVAPFLPGGRRGSPMSNILYVPGETLGPIWSGQQRRVDGVSLLEGAAWYEGALECLDRGGIETEGATVAGHHRLVASPLLSFLFFWACVCADAPACGVEFVSMLVWWSLLYL